MPTDLRQYVKVPVVATGQRQILTAKPTLAFNAYQQALDGRIKAIERREGPATTSCFRSSPTVGTRQSI